MSDLISREAMKEAFRAMDNTGADTFPLGIIIEALDEILAVDAEPVVHGRWLDRDSLFCRCSECGGRTMGEHNYCPNCGAKMDGDEHD